MIMFTLKHPQATVEHLGALPQFLSEQDPRPARDQLHAAYAHGGGWRAFQGFRMEDRAIQYPGDPPRPMIAEAYLRQEIIRVYVGAWVAIVQQDGSFEICRMD